MKLAKWGGNLAIRIPISLVRQLGLREGDDVDLVIAGTNQFQLVKNNDYRSAIENIKARNWSLPKDYSFNRNQANER